MLLRNWSYNINKIKKIIVEIENRIVFLIENIESARKIAKALQIAHYVVVEVKNMS